MRRLTISTVRDAIQTELWHSAGSELLWHLLSRGAKIKVFAGGVRDAFLKQECGLGNINPRDWDIGISNIPRQEFDGILSEVGGVKNRYGGFKLLGGSSMPWELWRQEDTVGLRKTESPFTLENVLRSFVLSCNALAFDLDTGHIYDHGALRSIFLCEITVLEDAIMHDWAVFSAKALSLTFRRPFSLSAPTERFVKRYLDSRNLVHELEKAYSGAAVLDGSPIDRQGTCRTSI